MHIEGNMAEISTDQFLKLSLSEQGKLAREILLNNMALLKNYGASLTLNIIKK